MVSKHPIELELKAERELKLVGRLICDMCKKVPATRHIQIGEVEFLMGSEYIICGAEPCLDAAFEYEHNQIDHMIRHPEEYQQQLY